MQHFKVKMNFSRGNFEIAQLSPKKCTTFRTIFKPRNDTISTERINAINANPSLQKSKVKITQQTIIQSQICLNDESNISKLPFLLEDSRFITQKGSIKQSKIVTPLKNIMSESRSVINQDKTPKKVKQNKLLQQLQQQIMLEEEKDIISMEGIQKKIDHLINTNLERFRNQENKLGLSNCQKLSHYAAFNNQFENIISSIAMVKHLQGEDRTSINNINKKIEILQKMIAIQAVGSQTLKDRYLGWKSQRNNTSSYINKYNSPKVKKQDTIQKVRQNMQIKSTEIVGNYTSTSKLSYSKPGKGYYAKPKKHQNSYAANRNYIPQSSYSSQFLNFGCTPNYSYKSNISKPLVNVPLSVTVSSYQQQYKDKLKLMSKLIDFKELDSYQDKIKNSKMPFINFKSSEIAEKSRQYMKKKHHYHLSKQNVQYIDKNDKNQQREKKDNLQSLQVSKHFYKTEQNRQFKWPNSLQIQNGVNVLRSEIKHSKLQKMKVDLKAMKMRC